MKKFNEEVSHWNEYNYIVVNDDLETCYDKLLGIITSEKSGQKVTQNTKDVEDMVKLLIK